MQIASDQVVSLGESLCLWKSDRNIDKISQLTLVKRIPMLVPVGPTPVLSSLSYDCKIVVYGGGNGQLQTLRVDTMEKGPSLLWVHQSQVSGVVGLSDMGALTMTSTQIIWTQAESLQDIKEHKTTVIRKFNGQFYAGEPLLSEGRILTFSPTGSLLQFTLSDRLNSALATYLQKTDFPQSLRPESHGLSFLVATTTLPREVFSFYFIDSNGQIIQSDSDSVSLHESEGYYFAQILHAGLSGVWRLCARLQNTERIRQSPPKLYYVHDGGYQQLSLPPNLPQSKKQVYNWLIGSIVFPTLVLHPSATFSDGSLLRYASLELNISRVSCTLMLNDGEFITAGEDGQLTLWDSQTFQVKNRMTIRGSETLSLYKMNDTTLVTGSRTGEVYYWKRVDPLGNFQISMELKLHEKSVYSITSVDNNTSLVTSSDDRKIILSNTATGALEVSETVDRTFVIALVRYQKDQFAGGFPDGRVKIWRKEKSGQKISVKLVRTIDKTVKVQHLTLINQSLLFIGGSEKVAEVANMDTGAKIKALKDGHQSSILCSYAYSKKYVISGGNDGLISIWNCDTGVLLKTYETGNQEIRQILLKNNLLITNGATGLIRVWQDVIPFLEQLVEIDLEQERLAKLAEGEAPADNS